MKQQPVLYSHGVPWEEAFGVGQGYSVNGTLYVSGQFSHDMQGAFVGEGDIAAQTTQTLENLDRVLAAFNVTKANLAELVIYVTDPEAHTEALVPVFKAYMGTHRPAVTLVGVSGLAFPHQLIEIKAVAHTD
ncbi:enamine deaminase RidA (YjgF/YER057c/UK114 family) [Variovorax boronicumulans]|uniref:Enamine deaminase RidA (YjgF/YER057c/UK114 family) n=1 Tax=Variovorax boronicumulans TaxID=436515 RepID=A0AAW8D2A9_9BURK|nr:RidA family protein [Variovorax boronicumulans]MDP9894108.1 enamine deaminase RidA (YjgF/YER057c/UK114 family) [Variovorax boronicumulans]MDP9990056.1 enamine deaminase RidA (YjgF/YER057c/UK114 family) [Variovorax boronicumulans]MDQ0001436.1 enamine deaminase RidA (YjgF/YER057c/UK114 family) [Variovorax boronicumulans]MDQ0053927.1 enamine deaminase RidA (YjgF/YER057c/UK114 family) [Variovorax boronicumulans]